MAEPARLETTVDPITLEIIRGSLGSAIRDMELLMERCAMSPFIKEKKDYFVGIFDTRGRIVACHISGSGPGMLQAIMKTYPLETMRPGDVYWFNDPYVSDGAVQHHQDMVFAVPIFHEGRLVAFATTFGHYQDIGGLRAGSGPPVVLLHGGPGLGFGYLRDLADELAQENDVAWYQQRGLEPSAVEGPYSVAADVGDARRVLDALGWQKAYVVGHSWGGHLALHVAEAMPDRLFGVLSVDPLGAVGDGGWAEFDEEMFRRTPEESRERAREIDELSMAGKADVELALEGMRLVWPAYYADPETAPAMPELRMAIERGGEMMPSIVAELPALEAGLPGIRVPVGFVHGSRSPMPVGASTDSAERIPGAWVEVVEGAGHFIWFEAPGAVRAALRRLTGA